MALAWRSHREMVAPPWPMSGAPEPADVDPWTAIQMGITGQQWANDPGGRRFADHLEPAIDMFLAQARRTRKEAQF